MMRNFRWTFKRTENTKHEVLERCQASTETIQIATAKHEHKIPKCIKMVPQGASSTHDYHYSIKCGHGLRPASKQDSGLRLPHLWFQIWWNEYQNGCWSYLLKTFRCIMEAFYKLLLCQAEYVGQQHSCVQVLIHWMFIGNHQTYCWSTISEFAAISWL